MRPVAPVFQIYRFIGDDVVWWRLVSPNGRGLARGTVGAPDPAAARESVEVVRATVEQLVPVLRLTETYRWRWLLTEVDVPVVQGVGDQDRRVRCANACRSFVELGREARVDPVIATFRRGSAAPMVARTATR